MLDEPAADGGDGLADAGQRRMQELGQGAVVVAGDGQVAAQAQPGGGGGVHDAHGDHVADAGHGRRACLIRQRQQVRQAGRAGLDGVLTPEEPGRVRRDARGAQAIGVALFAVGASLGAIGPGDKGDAAVAIGHQVGHNLGHAADAVHVGPGEVPLVIGPAEAGERDAVGDQTFNARVVVVGVGDEEAADLAAAVELFVDGRVGALAGDKGQQVVAGLFQAQDGRVEELVEHGVGDHATGIVEAVADEVGRLGAQVAGADVGAVVQFTDGGQHALAGFRGDAVAGRVVEDERHRGLADAGQPGDIAHGWAFIAARFAHRITLGASHFPKCVAPFPTGYQKVQRTSEGAMHRKE